jgi:hypothetical protein
MSIKMQFREALNTLFQHLSTPALYKPAFGEEISISVITKHPDMVLGLREVSILTSTQIFEIRVSELSECKEEDTLEVEGILYQFLSPPRKDLHHLLWIIEGTPV